MLTIGIEISSSHIPKKKDHSKMVHRYRKDRREQNKWRQQSVVGLIDYEDEDKQNLILLLRDGEELHIEEIFSDTDYVEILADGDEIGRLPKEYEDRCLSDDDGAQSAYLEYVEKDENGKLKPYIRIYWCKRRED